MKHFFNASPLAVVILLSFYGAVPAAAAASACVAVPSGLVGWWPGDSNENDIAGGNNPSSVSAVSLVPGEVLTGFSFGTKGYIQVPSSSTLANQTFTWAAWVRPDGPGPNVDAFGSVILVQNIDRDHNAVGLFWRATDGRFLFAFGDVNSEIFASAHTFLPAPFTLSRQPTTEAFSGYS